MALRTRIGIWLFAAAIAAAPSLAIAAADCAGCCCPPTPCHETAGDCESLQASMSCCDLEPASAPPTGLRSGPVAPLVAVLHSRSFPPLRAGAPLAWVAAAGPAEPLVSPLRLSVVSRN